MWGAGGPPPTRALRDPAEIVRRRGMLGEPHAAPLARWVESLRARLPAWEFADFDPLAGGVEADMLFVLEKPGPKTSRDGGSGFISVDNDDATAEAACRFLHAAGIQRRRICQWNLIPGWDRTIAYRPADWRAGLPLLFEVVDLLKGLKVVVLVGGVAQRAEPALTAAGHAVVCSAHPSPRVRAARPELWGAIPGRWRAAREIADGLAQDPGAGWPQAGSIVL